MLLCEGNQCRQGFAGAIPLSHRYNRLKISLVSNDIKGRTDFDDKANNFAVCDQWETFENKIVVTRVRPEST